MPCLSRARARSELLGRGLVGTQVQKQMPQRVISHLPCQMLWRGRYACPPTTLQIALTSCAFGTAPMICSFTSPLWKMMRFGMPRTP